MLPGIRSGDVVHGAGDVRQRAHDLRCDDQEPSTPRTRSRFTAVETESRDRVNMLPNGERGFDKHTVGTSVEELDDIAVEEFRRARLAAVSREDGVPSQEGRRGLTATRPSPSYRRPGTGPAA